MATALVTAGICFGITAVSGFGARKTKEPVYTFVSPFSAARAPALSLRCEYDSGVYLKAAPFLLCARFVTLNAGGTKILSAFGLTVRIKADSVDIERYGEQGYQKTVARFSR